MANFKATILTLFPEMFPGTLAHSIAGRALRDGIWQLEAVNLRQFGKGKHKQVDSPPCGGGNGLIMRPDIIGEALDFILENGAEQGPAKSVIYYPSPRGEQFNQKVAREIIANKNAIFLCGRYEGVDERVFDEYNMRAVSLGDYILSGGELAAMAMLDASLRLLPGVLENKDTTNTESFELTIEDEELEGLLLEYPLYTKPNLWRGRKVPDVLLSGDHNKIAYWQHEQAVNITKKLRPDLLKNKR